MSTLTKYLIVFGMSMVPVIELRGAVPYGVAAGLPLLPVLIAAILGNMVPVPFILLFIRKIFQFLKRFSGTRKIVEKLEVRSMRQSEKVKRWRNWGLLLFVAVPLPGTGGWTGALIAALLDIRIKTSLPIIALGVLIANLIMTAFSYGLLGIFVK